MLFNSYIFLFLFLPITWVLFRLACTFRLTHIAIIILMIASLVFYSYWNPIFVLLILISIGFNYTWGRLLEVKTSPSRLLLFVGVAVNLSAIGYFKYANFLMANVCGLFDVRWGEKDIFLPLGISFFTFQQIAYLVDCHRGITRERNVAQYALFVSFFPQLIAGPIVHHGEMISQFRRLRTYVMNYRNIAMGLGFLSLGLLKKLVIADSFSPWVKDAFDTSDALTFIEAWGAALAYTFQIYFDFSAYSDMAVGLGKLFNIDLPMNFNSPYKATSIIDFWQRWHMTLSRFLKDYIYIPLGGNRRGVLRRYLNLLATMFIGGLWHGAAWTFVFWGGLHGVLLCINHAARRLCRRFSVSVPAWAGWMLTFGSVVFGWVFFRAESFGRAISIVKGMLGLNGIVIGGGDLPGFMADALRALNVTIGKPSVWHYFGPHQRNLLIVATVVCLCLPTTWQWVYRHIGSRPTWQSAAGIAVVLCISVLFLGRVTEFLYFQF